MDKKERLEALAAELRSTACHINVYYRVRFRGELREYPSILDFVGERCEGGDLTPEAMEYVCHHMESIEETLEGNVGALAEEIAQAIDNYIEEETT
jgi:hypothetical protein